LFAEGLSNGRLSIEVRAPLLWVHRRASRTLRQVLQRALQAVRRQDRAPVWLSAPGLSVVRRPARRRQRHWPRCRPSRLLP